MNNENDIIKIVFKMKLKVYSNFAPNTKLKTIPVNIEKLIEKRVVSPNAQKWFYELISIIAEKHGLDGKVVSSRLDANPGEISPSDKLTVQLTCLNCQFEQKIVLPPFKVADFPDGTTMVYSADRITFRCKNCH